MVGDHAEMDYKTQNLWLSNTHTSRESADWRWQLVISVLAIVAQKSRWLWQELEATLALSEATTQNRNSESEWERLRTFLSY